MSATRGLDTVPASRISPSAASSSRRTSLAYCASRLASACCAADPAPPSPPLRIAFCDIRIVFCQHPEGGCHMAWDFETEPEFQEKLDWVDAFVREEVEPLDLVWSGLAFTPLDDTRRKVVGPLKEEVRRQGLWATHLGPELG